MSKDLADRLAVIREGLDRLSRLGNEPRLGNSRGNELAQQTMADLDQLIEEIRQPVMGEREAFEAWAAYEGYDITRDEDGDYPDTGTFDAWKAWQARAKASITTFDPNRHCDAQRVISWIDDPDRRPASSAFTAGLERQIAYRFEDAVPARSHGCGADPSPELVERVAMSLTAQFYDECNRGVEPCAGAAVRAEDSGLYVAEHASEFDLMAKAAIAAMSPLSRGEAERLRWVIAQAVELMKEGSHGTAGVMLEAEIKE